MNLETPNITIKKSQKKLFEFLCDLNNFEQLMPENTQKFEVDGDSFIFGLKGMPEIALEVKEINSPNSVVLGAISDKIPFSLKVEVDAIDECTSNAEFLFSGKFNSMMAMMIKSPLSKFLETLAENLKEI